MNKYVFEITDIFRGAFFLCNGGDLAGIKINGERVATFLIRGEGLIRLDREYRSGKALVNPLQFREALNYLRDILFNKLRETDPASHKCYAVTKGPASPSGYAVAKGGTRYGRERRDRSNQKGH
jgi:hypothetical protein